MSKNHLHPAQGGLGRLAFVDFVLVDLEFGSLLPQSIPDRPLVRVEIVDIRRPVGKAARLVLSGHEELDQGVSVLLKDVLIQASLDPKVRSIDYIQQVEFASETVKLAAIVIVRDDGRFWLDVADGSPPRDIEEEQMAQAALRDLGLRPLTLTPADIRREPRLTNARLVWSYSLCPVRLTLRMRILAALADDGPITLGQLLSSVHADRDPTAAVMALPPSVRAWPEADLFSLLDTLNDMRPAEASSADVLSAVRQGPTGILGFLSLRLAQFRRGGGLSDLIAFARLASEINIGRSRRVREFLLLLLGAL
jgi:hypothetical protein